VAKKLKETKTWVLLELLPVGSFEKTVSVIPSDSSDESEEDESETVNYHHEYIARIRIYASGYVISPGSKRLLCQLLQQVVLQSCHKLNQRVLLLALNETRVCSDLLVPPDPEDEKYPEPNKKLMRSRESKSEFKLEEPTTPGHGFKPGQFGCECVASRTFPLHERVVALRNWCTGFTVICR